MTATTAPATPVVDDLARYETEALDHAGEAAAAEARYTDLVGRLGRRAREISAAEAERRELVFALTDSDDPKERDQLVPQLAKQASLLSALRAEETELIARRDAALLSQHTHAWQSEVARGQALHRRQAMARRAMDALLRERQAWLSSNPMPSAEADQKRQVFAVLHAEQQSVGETLERQAHIQRANVGRALTALNDVRQAQGLLAVG